MDTQTSFGAYKVDATGAQVAKPSYLIQIQGGQRKIVWPQAAAEASAILPMPEWARR
jgi:branched-chain amino acid transport system substrate-binding protein